MLAGLYAPLDSLWDMLGAGVHFSRALTLSSHWLSVVDDAHSSLPPASTAREGLPLIPGTSHLSRELPCCSLSYCLGWPGWLPRYKACLASLGVFPGKVLPEGGTCPSPGLQAGKLVRYVACLDEPHSGLASQDPCGDPKWEPGRSY